MEGHTGIVKDMGLDSGWSLALLHLEVGFWI